MRPYFVVVVVVDLYDLRNVSFLQVAKQARSSVVLLLSHFVEAIEARHAKKNICSQEEEIRPEDHTQYQAAKRRDTI